MLALQNTILRYCVCLPHKIWPIAAEIMPYMEFYSRVRRVYRVTRMSWHLKKKKKRELIFQSISILSSEEDRVNTSKLKFSSISAIVFYTNRLSIEGVGSLLSEKTFIKHAKRTCTWQFLVRFQISIGERSYTSLILFS